MGAAWSRARAGQATDELAALDTATRGIAGVLDLDRVLQLITDRVRELASGFVLGALDTDEMIAVAARAQGFDAGA